MSDDRDRERAQEIARKWLSLYAWKHPSQLVPLGCLADLAEMGLAAGRAEALTWTSEVPTWTDEQAFALNCGQHNQSMHPYTCGNDSRHRPLIATRFGWRCADCEYRQDWAHGIPRMAGPPAPTTPGAAAMTPHTKPDSFSGEPRPVTPTTEPACEICGVGDRLRVTWIMRADHASTVVCEDCVREWYESGLTTILTSSPLPTPGTGRHTEGDR